MLLSGCRYSLRLSCRSCRVERGLIDESTSRRVDEDASGRLTGNWSTLAGAHFKLRGVPGEDKNSTPIIVQTLKQVVSTRFLHFNQLELSIDYRMRRRRRTDVKPMALLRLDSSEQGCRFGESELALDTCETALLSSSSSSPIELVDESSLFSCASFSSKATRHSRAPDSRQSPTGVSARPMLRESQ